jgi:hypothetical protein
MMRWLIFFLISSILAKLWKLLNRRRVVHNDLVVVVRDEKLKSLVSCFSAAQQKFCHTASK